MKPILPHLRSNRLRSSGAQGIPLPRRGVSQLSCGQTITVRNFPLLGSGPILSRMWPKKLDTAAVSVGRVPSGACFGEPVEEFDPRPVRNNIGDAQPRFVLRSEEHTSELQSPCNLVCRLLLEKKKISSAT